MEFERAFTVLDPAPVIIPPVAQTITEQNDELLLEITGQNFQPRATVTLTSGGTQYTGDVESLTANLIGARFSLSLIRAANNWQLVVTNPDGQQSNPVPFSVVLPAPIIESFVPKFAVNNSALTLTISGQYFQQSATVSLQAEGLSTLNPTLESVQSGETIQCIFNLANPTPGSYFVVVTNHPDGQQAWSDEQLQIFDPGKASQQVSPPAPVIRAGYPMVDEKAGRLKLTVQGQNFQSGMIVTLTDQGCTVKADVANPTTLFAEFDLLPVLNGPWTLQAQNPDGQNSGKVSLNVVSPPPVVESFIPTSSIERKDLHVTIRGQYFCSPVTVELQGQAGGPIASVQPANAINGEIVQADFSGTKLKEGEYYVTVLNKDGQQDWSQQLLKIEAHSGAKAHRTPKRRRRRAPAKGKLTKKPRKP